MKEKESKKFLQGGNTPNAQWKKIHLGLPKGSHNLVRRG